MKKLFLSFIAVSALTLMSCNKGECTAEAEASESSSVEEAPAEEPAVEADSLSIETAE
jgi:hypothetical protein